MFRYQTATWRSRLSIGYRVGNIHSKCPFRTNADKSVAFCCNFACSYLNATPSFVSPLVREEKGIKILTAFKITNRPTNLLIWEYGQEKCFISRFCEISLVSYSPSLTRPIPKSAWDCQHGFWCYGETSPARQFRLVHWGWGADVHTYWHPIR